MMRNVFRMMMLGLVALVSLMTFASRDASADEKQFVEKKCNKCHAVSAYNIEKKKGAKDDDDEDEGDDKVDPPDLSNVGSFHDAAFLTPFLKKEAEHKPHAGNDNKKKHKVKFKGSDDELKQMADWLVTLKKEPTKK